MSFCYACSRSAGYSHPSVRLVSCRVHAESPVPPAPLDGWVRTQRKNKRKRTAESDAEVSVQPSESNDEHRQPEPRGRTRRSNIMQWSKDAFADYFAERRKRLQSVRLPYGTPPLTPAQILRLVSDEWLRMDKDEKKRWLRGAARGAVKGRKVLGGRKERTEGFSGKQRHQLRELSYQPWGGPRCPGSALRLFLRTVGLPLKTGAKAYRSLPEEERMRFEHENDLQWSEYRERLLAYIHLSPSAPREELPVPFEPPSQEEEPPSEPELMPPAPDSQPLPANRQKRRRRRNIYPAPGAPAPEPPAPEPPAPEPPPAPAPMVYTGPIYEI